MANGGSSSVLFLQAIVDLLGPDESQEKLALVGPTGNGLRRLLERKKCFIIYFI